MTGTLYGIIIPIAYGTILFNVFQTLAMDKRRVVRSTRSGVAREYSYAVWNWEYRMSANDKNYNWTCSFAQSDDVVAELSESINFKTIILHPITRDPITPSLHTANKHHVNVPWCITWRQLVIRYIIQSLCTHAQSCSVGGSECLHFFRQISSTDKYGAFCHGIAISTSLHFWAHTQNFGA